jgi:transposase-like protein
MPRIVCAGDLSPAGIPVPVRSSYHIKLPVLRILDCSRPGRQLRPIIEHRRKTNEQSTLFARLLNGDSVAEISERLGVSSHSLYKWVRAVKPGKSNQLAPHPFGYFGNNKVNSKRTPSPSGPASVLSAQ